MVAARSRSFDELWEALLDVPEGTSGEIVNGEIRTHPRPGAPHLQAASRLGFLLGPPFDFASGGGPGGWVILAEPRGRFGDECRIPDLAGWRVERYGLPNAGRPYEVIPDWVCEVQSKSTAREDRTEKLPLYARHGVRHAWMIDAIGQTLEVLPPRRRPLGPGADVWRRREGARGAVRRCRDRSRSSLGAAHDPGGVNRHEPSPSADSGSQSRGG